ncbi:piggyBac transposable element-derived protein 4 [Trichonephila clavipes]|nr:piggyBac transposable element-derived protein 4 [Trichonephila clavipes]
MDWTLDANSWYKTTIYNLRCGNFTGWIIVTSKMTMPLVMLLALPCIDLAIIWEVSKINRSLDQLTFCKVLACQLVDGYSSRNRKGCPVGFQAKKCEVPDDVRLACVGNYMPKMVPNYRRRRKCSRKLLAFADGIDINSRTPTSLRKAFLSLEKEVLRTGLKSMRIRPST